MIKILKEIVGYCLVQLSRLSYRDDKEVFSIFFHNPPVILFERIVKWLRKENIQVIDLYEFKRLMEEKGMSRRTTIITFDDAWGGNMNLLKCIEMYEVPVSIFVPTEAVVSGNYWFEYARKSEQESISQIKSIKDFKELSYRELSKTIGNLKQHFKLERSCVTLTELKELGKNKWITIGSHTVNHPILSQCTPEEQSFELRASKRKLEEWLNTQIDFLAYPNGNYNNQTLLIAKEEGYKLCFTVNPSPINPDALDPMLIPRRCIDDNGGYYESIAKIIGVWQRVFPLRSFKLKSADL